MSSLYLMRYTGGDGAGAGVIYIGKGTVIGIDIGEIRYVGTYTVIDNQLCAQVTLTAEKINSKLVTGALLPKGQSLEITANLSSDFENGSIQHLLVAGRQVGVTFEKIGDIPD